MFVLRRKYRHSRNVFLRFYSKETPVASSSVRNRFIEYFVNENDHTFLNSSPIKPVSDCTIPFVNAGMVQFKSILQGRCLPSTPRAANFQKCARVGGKHNDLSAVGADGYHHTFFEMLGNWSFGSCNKLEACRMAWELLTGPYGLNPSQLYVTYFGGDSNMNLEPDLECRDIWRQLGIEESHVLPFGASDNFWEMGLMGPCGPCTEIHVDHIPGRLNAGNRVNAGFPDLTELWNIVFIQFNRSTDGSLNPLKQSHIDTGMGLERLVALLNKSQSNYDTDLFQPLMEVIHKLSGCSPYSGSFDITDASYKKDQAYRIIADHTRLLSVALADGVVPHNEYKLRWVLRRCLNVASTFMKADEKLIAELSNYVAESLHCSYPEIGRRLSKVKRVILHEAELYHALKQDLPKGWLNLIKEKPELENLLQFGSNPSALSSAYKKMSENENETISAQLAFHLFESHGMNADMISEMAALLGKEFNIEDYEEEVEKAKSQSKFMTAMSMTSSNYAEDLLAANIPETNSNFVYDYDRFETDYSFPEVSAKVVGFIVDGKLQSKACSGSKCGVLLDRTNFYHTAGGQESDLGEFLLVDEPKEPIFIVKEVTKVGGHVLHLGNLKRSLKVGDKVMTKIDALRRFACMRNHTLSHLINGEMQRLFDAPLQEKCVVHPSFLKLTYFLHGEEVGVKDVETLEDAVKSSIDDQLKVNRYSVKTWEVPPGTTLLPDETYPDENIHIIDIKRGNRTVSREPCCGTHVQNVGDIGEFCIVEVIKSKKTSICAVTGSEAKETVENSQKLAEDVANFCLALSGVENLVKTAVHRDKGSELDPHLSSSFVELKKIFRKHTSILKFISENSRRFSFVPFMRDHDALQDGLSRIHVLARQLSEIEVKTKAQGAKYLVHSLQLSKHLEKVPLSKYTRLVKVPVMLFSLHKEELKVRCCIPKDLVSEDFNAVLWMNEAMSHLIKSDQDAAVSYFKHEGQTVAVQTRTLLYKSRVLMAIRKERLQKAKEAAQQMAQTHFPS